MPGHVCMRSAGGQRLPTEVRKVCKAFLTESGLEGVRMQPTDRLPPATKALAGNRAGLGGLTATNLS